MMSKLKTNKNGIIRDTKSGALLTSDKKNLEKHKRNLEQVNRINTIESNIKDLQKEFIEIKTLLVKVLQELPKL